MLVLAGMFLGFIMLGIGEKKRHRRNLSLIPVRVHVNGTRGKSTVTRLIAAGLRAGGRRVVAKTTGTAARLILPDGSEKAVARRGPANIREQLAVVAEAARLGADTLVVECMAVQPELQRVSEAEFMRSTVGVITNVRPDHLDVMGPRLSDVARNLAWTIPTGSTVFTAEGEADMLSILEREAHRRGSTLVAVPSGTAPAGFVRDFAYRMFPDNLALALAVCQHLGVPPAVAYQGMCAAQPDPGVLRVFRWPAKDRSWLCVNAFAANDPVSTAAVLSTLPPASGPLVYLVNLRPDRPQRTLQYATLVGGAEVDQVVVVGAQRKLFARLAVWRGVAPERLLLPPQRSAADVMAALCPGPGTLVGIGNIAGLGQELVELWEREGEVLHGSHLWLGGAPQFSRA